MLREGGEAHRTTTSEPEVDADAPDSGGDRSRHATGDPGSAGLPDAPEPLDMLAARLVEGSGDARLSSFEEALLVAIRRVSAQGSAARRAA